MEDHHVDRPEVEAEQSAKLTGTNRSNPPDPIAVPPAGTAGNPPACSGKRHPGAGPPPGWSRKPDASPAMFANPHPPNPSPAGSRINPWIKSVKQRSTAGSLRLRPRAVARGAPWRKSVGPRIKSGGSIQPRPCANAHGASWRFGQPGGHSEGPNTRSHPELGRENPQRQWYCV